MNNPSCASLLPYLAAAVVALGSTCGAQAHSGDSSQLSPAAILSQATPTPISPTRESSRTAENPDRKFAEKAAASDLAEVEAGKFAKQNAAHPSVKEFADHMVTDHTTASEKLAPIAKSKGITLPPKPDSAHSKKLANLQKLQGDKFDREYIKMMVADHKDAVSLFEKEAKSGKDTELKNHAATLLPDLQKHLEMARSIESELKQKK